MQDKDLKKNFGFSMLNERLQGIISCIPCIEDHKKIKNLLPFLKEKKQIWISIVNKQGK
jgi:hypothetical protein